MGPRHRGFLTMGTESIRQVSDPGGHFGARGGTHRANAMAQNKFLGFRHGDDPFDAILVLVLWQTSALVLQVFAVCMARGGTGALSQELSASGFAVSFASAVWVLSRPRLRRSVRNAAVVCIAITPMMLWRMIDPVALTGYDEQLHLRTLRDIMSSHALPQPNPVLQVSPHYPGMEAFTALLQQVGLPEMIAVVVVVIVARLVLVLVLCDAVEQLTGSARAGGLAVAVYAWTSHFVFFDSIFSYVTLSLPLALAAVAFIARARGAEDPRLLLAGATVCLVAATLTHHVTAVVTAAFLVVWCLRERGLRRRRVLCGALIAVVVTAGWSCVQWPVLQVYFGPQVADVVSKSIGGSWREPFSSSAGVGSVPLWQAMILFYYAVAISVIVCSLVVICARTLMRRAPRHFGSDATQWRPPVFLVVMTAGIPVLLAARVVPRWCELSDRGFDFLFFPLSLLVAGGVVRWARSQPHETVVRVRPVALMLATGLFVGGYFLGTMPDIRLPGPYLPAAEGRSMDAETRAAVRWAEFGLPAGSYIGADRVSATLLANGSRMWPVFSNGVVDVVSLFFSDSWGPEQSEAARQLHLRYLYVDRRLADDLPLAGLYFWGEPENSRQLTLDELTKFDDVEGMEVVYRHGPVTIYDLSGLGVDHERSGWLGRSRPTQLPVQILIGLLAGAAVGLVGRFGGKSAMAVKARAFRELAGPSLTFAAGVGVVCVSSTVLLHAHVWLGPPVFLTAAVIFAIVNPAPILRGLRCLGRWVARVPRSRVLISSVVAVIIAEAISGAVLSAYAVDIDQVHQILHDPSAVHVPAQHDSPLSVTTGGGPP